MPTIFASVVTAVVDALNAGTPVSAQVHRARVRPGASEWATLVVVRLLDAAMEPFAVQGAPYNVDTQLAVECYARGSAGQAPDLAVDALLSAVYARLAADPTLGGLVSDLQPINLNYDFDADGEPTASATLTYTVRHRAGNQSLE